MENVLNLAAKLKARDATRMQEVAQQYADCHAPRLLGAWAGLQSSLRLLGVSEYAFGGYSFLPGFVELEYVEDDTKLRCDLAVRAEVDSGAHGVAAAIEDLRTSRLCDGVLPGVVALMDQVEASTTSYYFTLSLTGSSDPWHVELLRPDVVLSEESAAELVGSAGVKGALAYFERTTHQRATEMETWAHAIGVVAV